MLCSTMSTVRLRGDLFDQLRDPRHVLVAHALGGFIEEHQLRIERERRGKFEGALASIGQIRRQRGAPKSPGRTSASNCMARSSSFARVLPERQK